MAPPIPGPAAASSSDADFAKAFQELAEGERTAAALEKQLSALEGKIDELVEKAENDQRNVQQARAQHSTTTADQQKARTELEKGSEIA